MKRFITCLFLAALVPLSAQFSLDSGNRKEKPIKVDSDAMDIDMQSGKATFYGNVVVNDPDVMINCDRMILYRDNKKDAKDKKEADQNKEVQKDQSKKEEKLAEDLKLERIECIGNVVITRKNFQEKGKNQRGTCGKATYYHQIAKITMEIEPVLYQDDSKITGTTLSFFNNSQRISGTDIKIEARNLKEEEIKSEAAGKDSK